MSESKYFKISSDKNISAETIILRHPGNNGNYSNINLFIKGTSPLALKLFKHARLVATSDLSVILNGETGTGKESLAKYIHWQSNRCDKPFVAIDCGTLTKELAGSEFFGHEKGAFTGAIDSKIGQFELADGGTIFLDEIANLPYDIQVSLLRVLQEHKIRRIGAIKEIEIDVRIIVATNVRLEKLVAEGKFRKDLFHRINEFSLDLPALRERTEDIELFANYFLNLACQQLNKKLLGIQPQVIEAFQNYKWPGNLREMKNIINRAVLLTEGIQIRMEDIPESITKKENTHRETAIDLKSVSQQAEKKQIIEILGKVNNNKSKAAKLLNIDRKTLYNKLEAYGITEGDL